MADSLLDAIEFFQRLPQQADTAARLAINQTAQRGGLSLIRSTILDEIAFPKDYLKGDRLGVTQLAKSNDLQAVITARQRPTSLARFAPGQAVGSKARLGVRVTVGKGKTSVLRSAWLVRLPKGEAKSADSFNIGLAVRVKPGESVKGKKSDHQSWLVPGKVALLYGPSVDQIFREVSADVAKPIGELVTQEFLRQFVRLTS